jgi:UDP-2,3-diacylglucosamine pyrophosphatase LpxH
MAKTAAAVTLGRRYVESRSDVLFGTDGVRVRTLFISDVHLGTAACQADALLDFLRSYRADTIYLVGDIVEGWSLCRADWPRSHRSVLTELLTRAKAGVRVVYLPGNHDDYVRNFVGLSVGGIEVAESAVHECAGGQRYLVLHGDQFDAVVRRIRWLAYAGDIAYRTLIVLNRRLDPLWRRLGLSHESFSAWVKFRVKLLVNAISHSESLLVEAVRRREADGAICGHTHHADSRDMLGIHYVNAGDWVESCTGVVEHEDGGLEIVHWNDVAATSTSHEESLGAVESLLPDGDEVRHAA